MGGSGASALTHDSLSVYGDAAQSELRMQMGSGGVTISNVPLTVGNGLALSGGGELQASGYTALFKQNIELDSDNSGTRHLQTDGDSIDFGYYLNIAQGVSADSGFSFSGGTFQSDPAFTSSHFKYDDDEVSTGTSNSRFYPQAGLSVGGNSLVASNAATVSGGFTAKKAASTSGGMLVYHDGGTTEAFKTVGNEVNVQMRLYAKNGMRADGTITVNEHIGDSTTPVHDLLFSGYDWLSTEISQSVSNMNNNNYGSHGTSQGYNGRSGGIESRIDDYENCDRIKDCTNYECYVMLGWSQSNDNNPNKAGWISGAWHDYTSWGGHTNSGVSMYSKKWVGINVDNDMDGNDALWQSFRCTDSHKSGGSNYANNWRLDRACQYGSCG